LFFKEIKGLIIWGHLHQTNFYALPIEVKHHGKPILQWMVSQIQVKRGIFIPPFVLGYRKLLNTCGLTHNMMDGARVAILGFVVPL
jgi:hypothetical protein